MVGETARVWTLVLLLAFIPAVSFFDATIANLIKVDVNNGFYIFRSEKVGL